MTDANLYPPPEVPSARRRAPLDKSLLRLSALPPGQPAPAALTGFWIDNSRKGMSARRLARTSRPCARHANTGMSMLYTPCLLRTCPLRNGTHKDILNRLIETKEALVTLTLYSPAPWGQSADCCDARLTPPPATSLLFLWSAPQMPPEYWTGKRNVWD